MCSRDVAAGENHYHQRCADGERRNNPRASANPRAANCQDEKKCSDKFGDVFVHDLFVLTDRG